MLTVQIDFAIRPIPQIVRKWAMSVANYKLQEMELLKENSYHAFYSNICEEFSYNKSDNDICFFNEFGALQESVYNMWKSRLI